MCVCIYLSVTHACKEDVKGVWRLHNRRLQLHILLSSLRPCVCEDKCSHLSVTTDLHHGIINSFTYEYFSLFLFLFLGFYFPSEFGFCVCLCLSFKSSLSHMSISQSFSPISSLSTLLLSLCSMCVFACWSIQFS